MKKRIGTALKYALAVFFIVFTPLVAVRKTAAKDDFPYETEKYEKVLTVWHVDTFEGGTGSRADFLTDRAIDFGRTEEGKGIHFLVVTHTVESLEKSLSDGKTPDMVSFGIGAGAVGGIAKSIPEISFSGGEVGKYCYAYPWCVGGYFLITKTEDKRLIDELIVSQGVYNLPFSCFLTDDLLFEKKEIKEPMNAYSAFLSSTAAALLGTQRDIKRLETRGAAFFAEPIKGFSDLIQYVAVTTGKEEDYKDCLSFAEYLISEKVQKQLVKIGMASAFFGIYDGGAMSALDIGEIGYTVSPFTEKNALLSLQSEPTDGKERAERIKNALKRL